jgi:CBS domain-containing protein
VQPTAGRQAAAEPFTWSALLIATVIEPHMDAEILETYEVMRKLRPDVSPDEYLPAVRRLMAQEGYRLVAVTEDGQVRAVAGYRPMEMLYCGRILCIDDLITDERVRSRGFGRQALDWLKEAARTQRPSMPAAAEQLMRL